MAEWALKKIRLDGRPFSFKGHEYLRAIYDDQSQGDGDTLPVESYGDLVARVDGWDGTYPDPELWLRAETVARSEAEKQVADMEARAAQIEHRAFQRQIDAARLRLQRELGRYLVCVAGDSASLNGALHAQMSRDIATAGRLKRCLEKLGGYPKWPPEMCMELDALYKGLADNQRKARLLGREIEAALEDPRWMADLDDNIGPSHAGASQ